MKSLSRSAFAERFTALIGMLPMHYLTTWRLQLAAVRLRGKRHFDGATGERRRL